MSIGRNASRRVKIEIEIHSGICALCRQNKAVLAVLLIRSRSMYLFVAVTGRIWCKRMQYNSCCTTPACGRVMLPCKGQRWVGRRNSQSHDQSLRNSNTERYVVLSTAHREHEAIVRGFDEKFAAASRKAQTVVTTSSSALPTRKVHADILSET